MKSYIVLLLILFFSFGRPVMVYSQEEEIQQLLLDVEKLAELKKILQNMYEGYEILTKGYNAIKDISQGNFNIHKVFLDALLEVSPTVRKYTRIADIIGNQIKLVKEYKTAYNRFKANNIFRPDEIKYMGQVYANLFNESLEQLDELLLVITANQLRMSDDERLHAIDKIFETVQGELSFVRIFNERVTVLAVQRQNESNNIILSEKIFGVER